MALSQLPAACAVSGIRHTEGGLLDGRCGQGLGVWPAESIRLCMGFITVWDHLLLPPSEEGETSLAEDRSHPDRYEGVITKVGGKNISSVSFISTCKYLDIEGIDLHLHLGLEPRKCQGRACPAATRSEGGRSISVRSGLCLASAEFRAC